MIEDNAAAYKQHYHDQVGAQLGLTKIVWPLGSPDLNPIETIWNKIKDRVKARLKWNYTAGAIKEFVEVE